MPMPKRPGKYTSKYQHITITVCSQNQFFMSFREQVITISVCQSGILLRQVLPQNVTPFHDLPTPSEGVEKWRENASPSEGGMARGNGKCGDRRLPGQCCFCTPSEGERKMREFGSPSEGGMARGNWKCGDRWLSGRYGFCAPLEGEQKMREFCSPSEGGNGGRGERVARWATMVRRGECGCGAWGCVKKCPGGCRGICRFVG